MQIKIISFVKTREPL